MEGGQREEALADLKKMFVLWQWHRVHQANRPAPLAQVLPCHSLTRQAWGCLHLCCSLYSTSVCNNFQGLQNLPATLVSHKVVMVKITRAVVIDQSRLILNSTININKSNNKTDIIFEASSETSAHLILTKFGLLVPQGMILLAGNSLVLVLV